MCTVYCRIPVVTVEGSQIWIFLQHLCSNNSLPLRLKKLQVQKAVDVYLVMVLVELVGAETEVVGQKSLLTLTGQRFPLLGEEVTENPVVAVTKEKRRASIWIPDLTEVNVRFSDKRELSLALAKWNGLYPLSLILSWSWPSRIQQKHNKGFGVEKWKSKVKKHCKYRLCSTPLLNILKPWVSCAGEEEKLLIEW